MSIIDILKTASGNLLQSKLRTFLTVIAVFIGAMTLTLTNGIGSGISSYIDSQVASVGAKDVLFITPKAPDAAAGVSSDAPKKYDPNQVTGTSAFSGRTESLLTDKDIAAIKAVKGIVSVDPMRTISASYVSGASADKYQITISQFVTGTILPMVAGTVVDNASSQPEIVLPYNYSAILGFSSDSDAVGKTVTLGVTSAAGSLSEITATVSGVEERTLVQGGASTINTKLFDAVYAVQSQGLPAAALNKYPTAIAHFDVSYTDAQITDLKATLADKGYTGATIADAIGIVKQIINGIVIVFDLFGIIALLAASFGVINTLLMAVQERTKEIGLMKAMGMSGSKIFLLFSSEAILLGFWGSFLGVLAAMGIGRIANNYASSHFLKDFQGLTLLTFPPQSIAIIMLLIMAIAFLAGTLPARRAAKLNPIDALRYE
ncbi:MAG: FtsX-like permease family protein [bacterium]